MTSDAIAFNRSCLYGDGLFETMVYSAGQLRYWSYHWQRLAEGMLRLGYAPVAESQVLSRLQSFLEGVDTKSVVRLTVSRSGARGYRTIPNMPISIDVLVSPFPLDVWHGKPLTVRWCETQWSRQPKLAGLKHTSRLEQVLARSEWSDETIEEGLVRDTEGAVISGTMSALMVRVGQEVLLPKLSFSGIDSVARRVVLSRLDEMGMAWHCLDLTEDDVLQADELLLMNAVQGIGYVAHLAQQTFGMKGHDYTSSALCERLQGLF